MKEGIALINKPSGMTSHDVVSIVRRTFGIKRVGHAGTLDPLATGLLIILVGKSTKLSSQFIGFDKAYRSTLLLGTRTDSADIEGQLIKQEAYEHITPSQVEAAFKPFTGDIKQMPPMVSAVKVGGKKLYELARKGMVIERKARDVRIDCLRLEEMNVPEVKFYMECSKGTYVRQLADDVGDVLGCGACITQIQRTKIGPFSIEDAVELKDLNESHLRSWPR